jgi:archaellum component FlaC
MFFYTLLVTFKKMEQEIKNKIKRLEESIKELVKELSSKKTLTEKSILKTYDCIVTERKMINNYKSFLREFF